MATRMNPPKQRVSAEFPVADLKKGIEKLRKRIGDLNEFNPATINKRGDARKSALEARIDNTLREVLGDDSREYAQFSVRLDTLPLVMNHVYGAREIQTNIQENILGSVVKLETLVEMMEEKLSDASAEVDVKIPLPAPVAMESNDRPIERSTRSVFVVHGHDDGLRETVARFLAKLHLDPVILHEKANEGRTIIEKFEAHSDVDFAVVLFTPDDIGYPAKNEDAKRHRPRQNVVLELGFFIGRLGRKKVCVLHKGDMEMLTDIAGVLYVSVDEAGHWQFQLAKEIKAAGLHVDLNLAIG